MLKPGNFPALGSPQVQGSNAGRAKVGLKPGRSLMDWIRLGKSGKDLQGFCGRITSVSMTELAKHNKENDCWILLRGKVFNMTSYIEYHPGGVPEIMRAAGKDGTPLFDEYHKWVNFESMLQNCYIGPIKSNGPIKNSPSLLTANGPGKSPLTLQTAQMKPPSSMIVAKAKSQMPRYDWYQTDDKVTLTIFTKIKSIKVSDIIAILKEGKEMDVKVILGKMYFWLHLEFPHSINTFSVEPKSCSLGKATFILTKTKVGVKWDRIGDPLDGHNSLYPDKERDISFHQCCLTSIKSINYNTNLYTVTLPINVHFHVPIGRHCVFKLLVDEMELTRNYTAIPSALNKSISKSNEITIDFMIKIYQDGAVTSSLQKLHEGDFIAMSDPIGDFDSSNLRKYENIFLIAAGTGITPMLGIIKNYLKDPENQTNINLLFANREKKDILIKEELDLLATESNNKLHITYILSKPSTNWGGLTGRISKPILEDFLNVNQDDKDGDIYVFICGSNEFGELMERCVQEIGVTDNRIHCFKG